MSKSFISKRTVEQKQLDFSQEQSIREAQHPVHPLLLNRWSPRSYDSRSITDEELYTVLEAARWAPSAGNRQPWRFYVAHNEEERALFYQFINPRNQLWANKAPVLILLASVKIRENGEINPSHAFDAGAAWATLALQARLLGLSTRAMGGFHHDRAREVLNIPESLALHAVIALGHRGEPSALADESFRDSERPNDRQPLADSIIPILADR